MTTTRLHGDLGAVGGLEVLPFGILTFVIGSLLAANAWAVVDSKLAVTSASREAVRRYVEAPDHATASKRALDAARETLRGHGRSPEQMQFHIEHDGNRPWARCTRVRVVVTYPVPAVSLPWIGGYSEAFNATAAHSEIIDPFRAGIPGVAAC